MTATIALVGDADLPELLPLMRAYCDFYRSSPGDEQLLALARALLQDPEREGLQLIAREPGAALAGVGEPSAAAAPEREPGSAAVGFATLYWMWSTTRASRIGVMNDLYVAPQARGSGLAERLIEACVERCAERGAVILEWATEPSNVRAQTVYDRVGGVREQWVNYALEFPPLPPAGAVDQRRSHG